MNTERLEKTNYRGTVENWTESNTAPWNPWRRPGCLGMPGSIRLEVLLTHRPRGLETEVLAEPIRATVELVFSAGPPGPSSGKTGGVRCEHDDVESLYWAAATGHLIGAEVELTMLGTSWDCLRPLWDGETREAIRQEATKLERKEYKLWRLKGALAETVTKGEMEARTVALASTRTFNEPDELWEALAQTEWARERGLRAYALRNLAAKLGAWPGYDFTRGQVKVPAEVMKRNEAQVASGPNAALECCAGRTTELFQTTTGDFCRTCSHELTSTSPLWLHQQQAIATAKRAMDEGRNCGLWVMPTGTGKTWAAAKLAAELHLPTLVIVPRDEQAQQVVAAFKLAWPGVTVATLPGKNWEKADVVVAMVQSLARKLKKPPPDRFGLIVVDEAHHTPASSWNKVWWYFSPRFLLRCTATPKRLDGGSLSEPFKEPHLYEYKLGQAMRDGYLVPIRQHAIQTDVDLYDVPTTDVDFVERQLSEAVSVEARTRAVVEGYLRHGEGRPALVIAVDLNHVEQLRQAFAAAGVKAAAITSETKLEERRRILDDFEQGQLQVLVNCEVLTEGYDEHRISCVVMARPTLNEALYQQCVGRGLRTDPAGGKKDCLVLDVIDRFPQARVKTAASLFGGYVEDCGGQDVREAVLEEKKRLVLYPLRPSPAQEGHWDRGKETPWKEWPDLLGYRPTEPWEQQRADEKKHRAITGYGFEVLRPLTDGEANYLLRRCEELDQKYPTPATRGQQYLLGPFGLGWAGMTKHQARKMLGQAHAPVRGPSWRN
jgi:superfamily II DNA or RNA helicase